MMTTFFLSLAFLVGFGTNSQPSKTRILNPVQLIDEAKVVRFVEIYGYEDSIMLCGKVWGDDTLKVNCEVRRHSEKGRFLMLERLKVGDYDSYLAGKWPEKGERVLMVMSDRDRVTMFAKRIKNDFRFWDPNSVPFANSVFVISDPYRPIEECFEKQNNSLMCSDGCLISVNEIEEK